MIDRFAPLWWSVALLALLLLPSPDASAQFEDETTVVVVEVPVNVFRDGEPVRGLTKDDFEVLDGRKKQEIVGFEVIDLSRVGGSDSEEAISEISTAGRRHFLLIFDLSLSDPSSIQRARTAARKLLYGGLHPADLVGVATYTESKGAQMVLNFSPNREQAEVAIETLGLAQPAHRIEDPLSLMIGEEGPQSSSGGGSAGRADAIVEELSRDFTVLSGRVERDQLKNRIVSLTDSMSVLADMMRNIDGRKHVVFLSEGFPDEIFTGVEDIERQLEIAREVEFGQVQRVDSNERFGDSAASGALQQMVEAFQRSDCAVQTVDISGVEAGPDANSKQTRNEGLFRMARETGGELYQNYNELDVAMEEVLERTSVTYLLAIQPSDLKLDGKYHRLKVRLKGEDKGIRLVHRPGFYPPKPFEQQSALERKLATASTVIGGAAGGAFASHALAAPFPSPVDQAYVPVLVEIDGPGLLAAHQGDTLVLELYAYAFDDTGKVHDFFVRRVGLDTEAAGEMLRAGGFKYYGHLELDAGRYVVRVLARNAMTGDSSLSIVPLTVPDRVANEAALVPPLFPEPANRWVFGRESEDEQLAGAAYPFMLGDQPFVPAARPVVSKGANTICLPGFSLGEGALSLSAQLFTPEGAPVDGARIELLDRPSTGITSFDRLIAEFSPGSAPPGEYLLIVTVTDLSSGLESTASVDLVVEG